MWRHQEGFRIREEQAILRTKRECEEEHDREITRVQKLHEDAMTLQIKKYCTHICLKCFISRIGLYRAFGIANGYCLLFRYEKLDAKCKQEMEHRIRVQKDYKVP